ncbi:TraX family protein [Pseudoalteromonas nigrifaciens]|uniref:TraX family protein n=1 Tax=Pseudoalteromonas nigrifaciens TaxID=28109 RepID=UPI003FCEFB12
MVKLSNGALECLKWIALILMTGDHISTFLAGGDIAVLNNAGRIAMPLFAFVFAYNLNRENAQTLYKRSAKRLLIFGLISTPFYISLANTNGIYPLNILFTLAAGLLCIVAYSQKRYVELALVFIFTGLIVEYNWFGLMLIFTCYMYIKSKQERWLYSVLLSLVLLYLSNMNFYAFLAIPIILMFAGREVKFPRFKWAFYCYYPLHLCVLLMIKTYL